MFKAALFGVPLPLCSCGVIPVAASLRRHGASRAATSAFLISTPQTGVDSIMVTFSLLGPVLAVFRPIAALVGGIWGGTLVLLFGEHGVNGQPEPVVCTDACCAPDAKGSRLFRAIHHAFVTLPADISRSLLVGLGIAVIITTALPAQAVSEYLGKGVVQYLVMMALGIPVYVCATASVPVAAALIVKGVSPGAALVFLMTGPATNAAAIATIWRVMGRKTALLYLLAVASSALAAGVVLDLFFKPEIATTVTHVHEFLPQWLNEASAVALLGLLGFGLWRSYARPVAPTTAKEPVEGTQETLTLSIEGMTCTHCVETVREALLEEPGVSQVDVTLKPPRAVVSGIGLDPEKMKHAVEEAGYDVTGTV